MKSRDIIENYLIGIGISLKNTYTFIPKMNYEYSKTGKSETVELGNYKVKLTRKYKNTRQLNVMLDYTRDLFVYDVHLSNNLSKACDELAGSAVCYFAEFIKYIANNIEINADLAEKLITLVESAINNTEKEIGKVVSNYNITLDKIKDRIASGRVEMTAQAIADSNRVTGFYTTTYKHEGLFGDSYTTYATPITSGVNAGSSIAGANRAADNLQSVYEKGARDNAVDELSDLKVRIINYFNDKLRDLLAVKLDEYFDEEALDGKGKNLGENPVLRGQYINIVDSLKEEQFEDFKKVIEYYDINILDDLKEKTVNNIYSYFINEGKCDYDKVDYKLYTFLTNEKFGTKSLVSDKIKTYLSNVKFSTPGENKKLIETFERKTKLINDCDYLTKEEKESILKSYDDFKKKNKKMSTGNIIDIILSIIVVVIGIYAIITGIRYASLFGIYKDGLGFITFIAIAVALVVSFFVLVMNSSVVKKVLQLLLIAGFVFIPIKFNKPISDEVAMRDGKHKIEIRILDEKEIVFLKEGEKVPLENIKESGYVFNGWVYNGYYINTPTYVKEKGIYIADLDEDTGDLATITFKFKNGQPNFVIKKDKNVTCNLPTPPTRKGYKFVGWYDDSTKERFDGRNTYKQNKISVSAKWEKE